MKPAALFLAAVLCIPNIADSKDHVQAAATGDQWNRILLLDDACTAPAVTKLIVAHDRKNFRRALITWAKARNYEACWALDDGEVLIVDERAKVMRLEAHSFKPEWGI